jgi:hypothetical protein
MLRASRMVLSVAAAWLLSLGFDFFLHGGLLARLYVEPSPFLLGPEDALRRIPLGYLTFLILTVALYWFLRRLEVRGAAAGFRYGAAAGAVIWGALVIGLYSITTGRPTVLAAWWIGQTIELGLAGAVIGAGEAGAPLRRIWTIVAAAVLVLAAVTIVLQSTGLAGVSSSRGDLSRGGMIDIGSHRLEVRIEGKGAPAVVIDAGVTDQLDKLIPLQDRLAQFTRVVTYNRAGYGQSFGGALYSRFQPSQSVGIRTRLDLSAMILGAVNSEYAYLTVTPDQERLREYDYGPGAGLSIEASGLYKGRPLLSLAYRLQWINVKDGSIYVPAGNPGSDAEHFVHAAYAKLTIPIRSGMSLGMDAAVFLRNSYFSREDLVDTTERVPQARLYLAWGMGK